MKNEITRVAYVADWGNALIPLITPAGVVSTLAGINNNVVTTIDGPALSATFDCSYSVAVDSTGHVYVSDNFYSTIRKFTP
jgi:hypothetical protein